MRKILFVDDQPEVLRGLRRALATIQREWDIEFATSGEEALGLMSSSNFDVVVSDMRMPEMNGVKLLNTIMKRYPDTVRIILSGYSDSEMIMKTVNCAHQFLSKPCDPKTIQYTILRACKLKDLLRDNALRMIVTVIKNLPSLPTLYSKILEEMQSPNASLKNVSYIISQDTSMTAKVLQIVNSAFFGLRSKIMDPQQAAVYLGLETLKGLILSIHVFSSFSDDVKYFGQSLEDLSVHSLKVGSLAKEIARNEMSEPDAIENAFVSGLLHDIGKLILVRSPCLYGKVSDLIDDRCRDTTNAEYTAIKTSHAELGAYLLGIWGLPDCVVETVAFHHKPLELVKSSFVMEDQLPEKDVEAEKPKYNMPDQQTLLKYVADFRVLTYVHVANALITQGDCSSQTSVFPYVDMDYLEKFNLTHKLPEWVECYNKLREAEAQCA